MAVEVQKAHANTLSRERLEQYIRSVHASTLSYEDRTELLEHCEAKLERLNRNNAMVERSDTSDFENMD